MAGNREVPVQIAIGQAFAVGKFAVSFDEWDACVENGGCGGYRPSDAGWGRGQRPVVNIAWTDAVAYVAWLSQRTGKAYRLLTESEREYVARATTTTAFWWGNATGSTQANYDTTTSLDAAQKPRSGWVQRLVGSRADPQRPPAMTAPVNAYDANGWGLYQVHGNVWEWTQDCWHDANTDRPVDGSAGETGDCTRRVVRGGAFDVPPEASRSASRFSAPVGTRDISLGVRVARSLGK